MIITTTPLTVDELIQLIGKLSGAASDVLKDGKSRDVPLSVYTDPNTNEEIQRCITIHPNKV